MTFGEQARWWGVGLLLLVGALVLLSDVLLPFLLAAAIAYFTDPLADWLQRRGLSRVLSTIIITAGALIVCAAFLMVLVPVLINQIRLAVDAAPGMIDAVRGFVESRILPLFGDNGAFGVSVTEALKEMQGQIKSISGQVLQGAWSVGLVGFQLVTLAVLTPVVAFYLLLDWDNMVARVDELLPREHADTIRELACRVDDVLAGFVRGQLTVCLILGGFYAAALVAIQLPFGLLVGLLAGLISFIPFVGAIVGGALSIGIALVYFWSDPLWIFVTAGIFAFGQVVEGNFLSPKLVGDSVGLHPVWLIFALSAFGALFGFTGLLVAVPAAAVIGVFLRFSAERYKHSRLYRGENGGESGGRGGGA